MGDKKTMFDVLTPLLNAISSGVENGGEYAQKNFAKFVIEILQVGSEYENIRHISVVGIKGDFYACERWGENCVFQIIYTNEELDAFPILECCAVAIAMEEELDPDCHGIKKFTVTNGIFIEQAHELAALTNVASWDYNFFVNMVELWYCHSHFNREFVSDWIQRFSKGISDGKFPT